MSIRAYLESKEHLEEKKEMKVMQAVIDRIADEKPFQGLKLVSGQLLVRNSIVLFEALWRGGAEVVLCNPFFCDRSLLLANELIAAGFTIYPIKEAALMGDWFVDAAGVLGQVRAPKAAVEVTRSGHYVYQSVDCPTICIDDSRIKNLEDYLGTGESFVRGWTLLRPDDPIAGKKIILFGYGKVGRGVAHSCRLNGSNIFVIDPNPDARKRSTMEGFEAIDLSDRHAVKELFGTSDIVIGTTGIVGGVSNSVPHEWLLMNNPFLVNIGMDEFGDAFDQDRILGGNIPINFHLQQPTKNRYIDPVHAALVLGIEEMVKNHKAYTKGVHPLPASIDEWVLNKWMESWPDEDISNLEQELNLSSSDTNS
ncbi:MAG: NAD-binding protein [Anaerolineales bacterium]|nr:NAD-binding protein [Anaerolineales bacterium]